MGRKELEREWEALWRGEAPPRMDEAELDAWLDDAPLRRKKKRAWATPRSDGDKGGGGAPAGVVRCAR